MSTRLILIRHGLTEWNRRKRYCGSVDIGLDTIGRMQARRLRARLKGQKIDSIYSSDKKRAIETAKIIFGKREIKIEVDLREIHFGVFEGLTYKKALEQYPRVYRRLFKSPFKVKIPDGESLGEFKKRVVKAVTHIAYINKNKTTAIVCHAGPISIFINHILKSKDFWGKIPDSASISIIEYERNTRAKVILFNDTAHLANIPKFAHASAHKV